MNDKSKTKGQLINELIALRTQNKALKAKENLKNCSLETIIKPSNYYITLIENLPQKIFHKDRNSVYVSCNGNYARDLKITPEEITGKTDYDFYPRALAEKYRADDKRVMDLNETIDIEEKYVKDGREETVQTVKTPVKDEKGSIVGVLGIFWDITDRKEAEEVLNALRADFRNLQHNKDHHRRNIAIQACGV